MMVLKQMKNESALQPLLISWLSINKSAGKALNVQQRLPRILLDLVQRHSAADDSEYFIKLYVPRQSNIR